MSPIYPVIGFMVGRCIAVQNEASISRNGGSRRILTMRPASESQRFPLTMLAPNVLLMMLMMGCVPISARREPVRIVEDAHSGGNALAVSADSRFGASGGWAGRIRLWRLPDGESLSTWQTPHGDLNSDDASVRFYRLPLLTDGDALLPQTHHRIDAGVGARPVNRL